MQLGLMDIVYGGLIDVGLEQYRFTRRIDEHWCVNAR